MTDKQRRKQEQRKRDEKLFRSRPVNNISLGAMFTAFTLIFLYLAGILPVGRVVMFFISSLFAACMVVEKQPFMAFLVYAASSGLALLILPDRLSVLPYVLLFGHYGLGKCLIEKKIKDKITAFIVKLVYFDICMGAIYFLCYAVFITGYLAKLPLWVLIVGAQVAFVAYDYIYSRALQIYEKDIRKRLLKTN